MTPYELAKKLEINNNPYLHLVRETRPYTIPKGYISWKALSACIAYSLNFYVALVNQNEEVIAQDAATKFTQARLALWYVQDAPIYCIGKDLLREFEQTDVEENPHLMSDLINISVPTFLILFPDNPIISPEGGVVYYAIVHLSDRTNPDNSKGSCSGITVHYLQHEFQKNFNWATQDSKDYIWFSGTGLNEEGKIVKTESKLGTMPVQEKDNEFLNRIKSVCIQCLLSFEYFPALLESSEPLKKVTNVKSSVTNSNPQRRVRWIGRTYKSSNPQVKGTHASPRTHWRRGFVQRKLIGKRDVPLEQRQYKWVRIKPTRVNSK